MMTVTIQFDLPEDQEIMDLHLKGPKYRSIISDYLSYLRDKIKYQSDKIPDDQLEVYEDCQRIMYDLIKQMVPEEDF